MVAKIDRTEEKNINNFGSEMVIVEYRTNKDIDVYFPEYDCTVKNREYKHFKNGKIKCPYERTLYEIGYIGEGKYKTTENGKNTRIYKTWKNMLRRCYSEKEHKRSPTYIDCTVCEEWHNFQNFAEWYENNYYEIEGERMELDKDILVKHNKIYSPETCVFVTEKINTLFTKRQNDRGESAIGTFRLENEKYRVYCNLINPKTGESKQEYLRICETQEKAFEVYKYYKEKNIKQIADYYKEQIPINLYNALCEYEVEITD